MTMSQMDAAARPAGPARHGPPHAGDDPAGVYLAAVDKVRGILGEEAGPAEAARDFPPRAMDALREEGFFRLWLPRTLGGFEVDPTTGVRVFEELAAVDSAAGWIVANANVIITFSQGLADDGIAEVFARPDDVVAGGWFPPGPAAPVPGGYRVTGQWGFGTGCRHAQWLTAMGVLVDEQGAPQLAPTGQPALVMIIVPAADGEIVDTWRTLGMRGTGSHDVRLTDVFVPERRAYVMRPFEEPASAFRGPLYGFHLWLGGPVIAAVALGVARAALQALVELAGTKVPSYTSTALADRPIVHDHVARARAGVDGARAYLHRALDDAYAHLAAGGAGGSDHLLPVQLAACHAVDAATRAVDLVQGVAGTTGIRDEHPFQQHFRDVHTIAQHTLASAARFESAGQILVGRPSDWGFFYL